MPEPLTHNMQPLRFWKYHGLGNDYLVVDTAHDLTAAQIQQICHRNYGIGSDGILVQTKGIALGVKIYNPDGSEAEKSGNGLRIFTRYLYDTDQIGTQPVPIETLGGTVTAQQLDAQTVRVGMGKVAFEALHAPLTLPDNKTVAAHIASIGNPHCVLFGESLAEVERLATELGPALETHPRFPKRTNVQFVHVVDRATIYIAIWERGAGRTLASGSSSCAAAAVAQRLGYCDRQIAVQMAGGTLQVTIGTDSDLVLEGQVVKVGEGVISAEILP